jgi:flagellar motor switch protein FliG
MDTTVANIRKIAILLDSLDMDAADHLLEQFSPADVAMLREAMMSLAGVDATEQEAVLTDILKQRSSSQDDLVASSEVSQPQTDEEAVDAVEPCQQATGFVHLETASPALVATRLQQEEPQVIAAILSRLKPATSAAILRELAQDLQVDLLRRITELDELPGPVIDELAEAMREFLQQPGVADGTVAHGLAAAHAILEATDPLHRHELMDQLARDNNSQPAVTRQPPTPWLQANAGGQLPHPPATQASSEDAEQFVIRFEDLALLDDTSLATVIQSLDPQLVLLALAGASREFVDRILRPLDQHDSRLLRRRMEQIGPVQLQDISRAQQALASHAIQLAAEGRITIHNRRRFVMAA